jgi:hypothetical protein
MTFHAIDYNTLQVAVQSMKIIDSNENGSEEGYLSRLREHQMSTLVTGTLKFGG